MAGDPLPYLYRQLLICFRLVKLRITPAVSNVRTCLSPGCAMRIKDYVKVILCSPANDLIEQSESLFQVREEELVVQGNANGVDSGPGNETPLQLLYFPIQPTKTRGPQFSKLHCRLKDALHSTGLFRQLDLLR
jgi:hypothetical protein